MIDHPLFDAKIKLEQYDSDFEDWWKMYPRKVDKKMAKRAYIAQRKAGAGKMDLLEAADQYSMARENTDPRFTKHPSTFLNNGWDEWVGGNPEAAVSSASDVPDNRDSPFARAHGLS